MSSSILPIFKKNYEYMTKRMNKKMYIIHRNVIYSHVKVILFHKEP